MYPPPPQSNPPVTRTVEQIFSQQLSQVAQYLRLTGRVQTMAAVINRQATQVETARIAAHIITLFDDNGISFVQPRKPPCGAEPRRTSAKDCDSRSRNGLLRAAHISGSGNSLTSLIVQFGMRSHVITTRQMRWGAIWIGGTNP